MKPFGHNKRFPGCKPCSGYQPMHLNPTTRGKIIFKINPLDMVFPTWVSPPLTSQIPFSRLPTAKVHFPHWIAFLSNNPIRTSFFAVVIDPLPFLILTSYSFYTQVMVILVLIDVQYLQNVCFLALKKVRMIEITPPQLPTTQ